MSGISRDGRGGAGRGREAGRVEALLAAAIASAAFVAAGASSEALASSGQGSVAEADGTGASAHGACVQVSRHVVAGTGRVRVHNVQGTFSYSQAVVTPTDRIVHDLGGTSKLLCADDPRAALSPQEEWGARVDALRASFASRPADALATRVAVSGACARPYEAALREVARTRGAVVDRLMGYMCADNPPDGRAVANARVHGISLDALLDEAGVDAEANVIAFVARDGYVTRLPLDYVLSHGAVIACEINGEPISQVTGSANQLWIGATSARYSVRDVVGIRLEVVPADELPPAPATDEAGDGYLNRPNVGVLVGMAGDDPSSVRA